MKRIDEILFNMWKEIEANYGMQNSVLKITVTHELFDKMVFSMAETKKYSAHYTPSWMNDFNICGVRIEARASSKAEKE